MKKSLLHSLRGYVWLPTLLFVLLQLGDAALGGSPSRSVKLLSVPPGSRWVAAWRARPRAATLGNLSAAPYRDLTMREVVFTSAAGDRVRVRLSNAYGRAPLRIGHAAVALQSHGAQVIAGTTSVLRFGGRTSLLIEPGAEATSDPAPLAVGTSTHLAVSIFLPGSTGAVIPPAGADVSTYVATGPHVSDGAGAFRAVAHSWYLLSGVDVLTPRRESGYVIWESRSSGSTSSASSRQRRTYP